jgi:ubiquinone/menaquinone biosynthesis C-methylase UbiE
VDGHPIFARIYDRLLAGTERAGLAEIRRDLIASATGRTIELGAGTGHNLEHYTDAVTELILAEPDPHMATRLRSRLAEERTSAVRPSVIEAPAEDLPFDDGSFDTVVATLVFCTVEDPERAIAEARRVLVEGGRLLYVEHVRSTSPRLAWTGWSGRGGSSRVAATRIAQPTSWLPAPDSGSTTSSAAPCRRRRGSPGR